MSRFPFILGLAEKIPIKIAKKFEKLKNHFPALFLAKTRVDRPRNREKKNFAPISVHTRPGEENSEQNSKKIKKLKNLFPELFLAKTGVDWPKKREKKILSRFPFKLILGKKIPKKIAEN